MDRVIGILRVVAAPMVKKTVNLDFVQKMKFVSIECSPHDLQFQRLWNCYDS